MAIVGEWVWIEADKLRVGLVPQVQGDRILVALGTGTVREPPRVVIEPQTRLGRRLGLTKDTYFYPATIRGLAAGSVRRSCGSGPMEKFCAIEALLPDVPPSSDRGGEPPSTT